MYEIFHNLLTTGIVFNVYSFLE